MDTEVKGRAGTCLPEQRPPAFLTVQPQPGLLWLKLAATAQTLESVPWRAPCFLKLMLRGGCWGQHSQQLLKQGGPDTAVSRT